MDEQILSTDYPINPDYQEPLNNLRRDISALELVCKLATYIPAGVHPFSLTVNSGLRALLVGATLLLS